MAKRRSNWLPKYCSFNTDRHGRRRIRYRRNGFSTYLTAEPGTEDFTRQYAAAEQGLAATRGGAGRARTRPGSFDAVIAAYYASPEFQSLSAATKATYRGIIERFRNKHGRWPVAGLERRHLKAMIGAMADRPAAANNLLRMLRMLLNFAMDMGLIQVNPAIGMRGFATRSQGFHAWSEDEIARFRAAHRPGSRERMAFELLLNTGQRRGDVVQMGWQHITDGGILVAAQQKTGEAVWIPLLPELVECLERLARTNMTFLVTHTGAPFSPAGFGNWFRAACNDAGLSHCAAHGLRKAAARRLAEAGCTEKEIAAITGHKTLKEVARYTAAANQRHLATQAHQRLLEAKNRTKIVQP